MKLPKSLTTVTPLSKTLAAILLITFPFIGFYAGTQYQKGISPQATVYPPDTTSPAPTAAYACDLDAKLCPDGSTVGREGPNCEFAPCPGDLRNLCQQKGGTWLEEFKECESQISDKGMDQNTCTSLAGKYTECDSACRHDPKAEVCIGVCVKTCKF